jgi:hypothetical protein
MGKLMAGEKYFFIDFYISSYIVRGTHLDGSKDLQKHGKTAQNFSFGSLTNFNQSKVH